MTKYVSKPHYIVDHGCNRLGQCTSYYCGVHSLKQVLAKFNDVDVSEKTLAGWAGTTTAGTSVAGLRTALKKFNKKYNKDYSLVEKEFNSYGGTDKERYQAIGKVISSKDKAVIVHSTYQLKYGHYEVLREVDTGAGALKILNSLGTRYKNGSYAGYVESRSYGTMSKYIRAMSQPSIIIISK